MWAEIRNINAAGRGLSFQLCVKIKSPGQAFAWLVEGTVLKIDELLQNEEILILQAISSHAFIPLFRKLPTLQSTTWQVIQL